MSSGDGVEVPSLGDVAAGAGVVGALRVVFPIARFPLEGGGDADGVEELLALDSHQTRILQILTANGRGEWESALHFAVFETDPHYQGRAGARSEPREMLVTDLNSDERPDVALLVHDRLLIYTNTPASPEDPRQEQASTSDQEQLVDTPTP